ncbi:MAG: potassium transporter Kef [Alphaproteobacteria bacterium]|nr:MAG: potassium transporter Kef [Alphaproteobacteria bacterium]
MEPIFLTVAFVMGFAARQINLAPMIGFLLAGFVLNGLGYDTSPLLNQLADLGVILLLFSIGLKLQLKTLLKPEVWAVTSVHMIVTIVLFGLFIFGLGLAGLHLLADLTLTQSALVAFMLSFSSTVFTIKSLEEKGELQAIHGRIAIGILIIQDIIAVLFITFSSGKLPSIWSLALVGLVLLRPLFFRIMDRSGHGELIPLFGLFAAIVLGAASFDLVGMKADLGALVLGVLLAGHPRASEISDSLLTFKDVLLVGFFLNIGLTGALSLEAVLVALIFVGILPFKIALFFFLITRFKLRARSASLGALSLASYSEFGLIVGALAVSSSWIAADWLTIVAISLAGSFIFASPINMFSHQIYDRLERWLLVWQTPVRHADEQPINADGVQIVVLGMGRIGTAAFDTMMDRFGTGIMGLESNPELVERHKAEGRRVSNADTTDADFWRQLNLGGVSLIVSTLPDLKSNLEILKLLGESDYQGKVAAVARYPDEQAVLEQAGADLSVDSITEAGIGIAAHVMANFDIDITRPGPD